ICGLDRAIWRGILSVYAPSATLRDTTARAAGDDACVAHVVEAGATRRAARARAGPGAGRRGQGGGGQEKRGEEARPGPGARPPPRRGRGAGEKGGPRTA